MKVFLFILSSLFSLYAFDFPKDHNFHDDFKIEWCYFVGVLETEEGESFGYELSFFKGIISEKKIYPVHFAISDFKNKIHYTSQTLQRESTGLAKIKPNLIQSGEYSLEIMNKTKFRLKANPKMKNFALELDLESPETEILLHGEKGYSKKSRKYPNIFSYYYSIPKLKTKGFLQIQNKKYRVNNSYSWMDHEWSSAKNTEQKIDLSSREIQWDWISIQFEDGSVLMCFNFRKDKKEISETFGTYRDKEGKITYLEKETEISFTPIQKEWKSAETQKKYNLNWEIKFQGKIIQIEPYMNNQEFIALESTGNIYWEGAIQAKLVDKTNQMKGRGYLELKGN